VYSLGIYDWSQVTTPPELTASNLANDGGANDPGQSNYNPGLPSWTDKTYTFNGGSPTKIKINDDDSQFEDGYVETGGAATLAEDVVINGTLYPAGSVVENEFSLVDGFGNEVYVVRINGENVGFAPMAPYYSIPAGTSFTPTEGRGGTVAESSDGTPSDSPYSTIICFAPRTRIATPNGDVPAGRLRRGDLVLTADDGPQPILWTARTELAFDTAEADTRPVVVQRDALGPGVPRRDLIVSQQHRFLVSAQTRADVAPHEYLTPARGLLSLPGVRIMRGVQSVSYVHILLENHAILSAEGVATESFYPGPMAVRALSRRDRKRLDRAIPSQTYGAPARQIMPCQQATELGKKRLPGPSGIAPLRRLEMRSFQMAAWSQGFLRVVGG